MNLELTDEQLALRDLVRRFLSEKAPIGSHVRAMIDEPTGTTKPVWAGLAGLGATAVLTPPDHGGLGLGMVDAGVVAEELGRALHPGPWLSTAVTATRALTRTDGGADTAVLLAGIADGSTIATVALDSVDRPATVAFRSGGAVLTGDYTEVPDAAAAGVLLVVASDGTETALYAVDSTGVGVTITALPSIDPTRRPARVAFAEASARRLGSAPHRTLAAFVDDTIAVAAADAVGAAQALFDSMVDYAGTRVQFGQPIGAFQAVQHLCVDSYETIELARSGVAHALWAADSAPRPEAHTAAARAKAFAGKLASVGDTAVQVFGGIGFTWEHDAHLYLKRLLGFSAFLGSPDRYLRQIGAGLIASSATPLIRS